MRYLLSLLSGLAFAQATPNMGLVKPEADDTNYRQKIDTILNQVDAHDHTTGKGVQIPSSGIADGAITSSKIAGGSITSAKIAVGGVSTQNIADGAITIAKRATISMTSQYASVGNVAISPVSTLSTSTSSFVNVTSQEFGLVSTGRPVAIGYRPSSGGSACFFQATSTAECSLKWVVNGSDYQLQTFTGVLPCTSVNTVVPLSAGSYFYVPSIRRSAGSGNCVAQGVSSYGYEL